MITENKKLYIGGFIGFVLIFCLGFISGQKSVYHVPQPGTLDFSLFWEAYSQLQKNFVDPSKIDNQKITYGAIEGMAQSLGDPYTTFFDPQAAKNLQSDLAGSFEGIGAEVGSKKGILTIIAPLPETPAQKAGLKAGDMIVKIDKKDASNISVDQAINLIRGPKGSTITLSIFRDGWNSAKDFTITRSTIKTVTVKWSIKDNDVAYVQIFQFDRTLAADFQAVAQQILQSKAKRIVLDLRNNPGGYLDVAQDVAGWFLANGQTITMENYGGKKPQDVYQSEGSGALASYPTVILVNQGSASASEILSGALRDDRGVKLIGTKSFGKGSVQNIISMPGGSLLKITIAKWLTPKGQSISEVGLSPDVSVELTDADTQANKDPQLDKALEIVKSIQ